MTCNTRVVRSQKASKEPERPAGQTWSAYRAEKRCVQPYPILSYVRGTQATKVST